MKSRKIVTSETEPLLISSLPPRPNQKEWMGGVGYSSAELRAAFDKLPLLLVGRYNDLIDDITSGDICQLLSTNSAESQTLSEFLEETRNGVWASKFQLDGLSLRAVIQSILARLDALEEGEK